MNIEFLKKIQYAKDGIHIDSYEVGDIAEIDDSTANVWIGAKVAKKIKKDSKEEQFKNKPESDKSINPIEEIK